LKWFRQNRLLRTIAAIIVGLTAILWAITFYTSLWAHMASFANWVPATMK